MVFMDCYVTHIILILDFTDYIALYALEIES